MFFGRDRLLPLSLMSRSLALPRSQHLSGLHCYANDRTSVVAAHHFCSCVDHDGNQPKLRQCIIYDSDKPDARLIGVEYVASEDVRHSGGVWSAHSR